LEAIARSKYIRITRMPVAHVGNRPLKRAIDFNLAACGIFVSFPLWIAIALVILKMDGRPIFFHQERCGKGLRRFDLIKFRTMVNGKHRIESAVNYSSVTRLGRYLRVTGLDSLPELLNILKGDMSFVGPRPMPYLVEDEPKYKNIEQVPGHYLRSQIQSGLTGLAQLYVPKTSSRRNKYRADNLYVRNASLWLDFKIFWLSILFTIRGKWERVTHGL
jgi:lipopolysaccharide/colanic/teichoic acid biosynthesis glycosyltransferase